MSKRLAYIACLALVLGAARNVSAQLLVHYKLDETAGTIVSDSSGKGNDGRLAGDAQWVAGWLAGALQFNGGDSVTLPADRMGLRSDTGSVTFWMNMTEVTGGINTIWWGGDNTTGGGFGPENEMHIHVEAFVSNIWEGGELAFHGQNNPNFHLHSDPNKGDAPNPPNNPILMTDGQWHHVAATWGNNDGNVKLYLDGVLLHEIAQGNRSYPLSNMYLGQMANAGRTYNGLLDDVQIYGGALTPEQVQIAMKGGVNLSLKAALPEPAHQATDVPRDIVLTWLAGDRADTHNVYFGTALEDVRQASIADPRGVLVGQNQADAAYDPPGLLDFDRTYCWRVDEVNAPPDSGVSRGNVWSFTTVNFVVVDDFESYTDYPPDEIFNTWIDGFGIETNGAVVGHAEPDFAAGEHYAETTIVHGGKQSMPFFYDNNMKYSEAERTLASGRDWTADDVIELSLWFRGYRPYLGSFVEAPAGTYTMTGSGADIWGGSDEFHFAFKQVTGATAIVAKVERLENTDPFAKAGVMIRDTLEPQSRNAAVFITPENGVRFQFRRIAGGVTERYFAEGITAPQWVKLERTTGGLVRAYYSQDGATWTRFDLVQVTMGTPLYVGLAVTSHNAAVGCEAVFTNVSFPNMSVDPQWTDVDIGIQSNDVEPMYVALSNHTGTPAAIYHDDPNASTIDAWTEWVVPLQKFADRGVDLTDVDRIAIGFGTKGDTTKPGGSGTVYFDDIRLYRPPKPIEIPVENFGFELSGTQK